MIDAKVTRLTEMIERIMRSAQRLVRGGCDDVDLTPPQTFLLRALDAQGAMTLGELRRHFNAAQSTTSEMVGRLARSGYITKKPDPNDRRSVKIAITATGRAVMRARLAELKRRHRAVFEALSPEDQERFLGAFETIVELMDRAAGNVASGDDDEA
jgi:DNA-binding MarR family transcriptional regulator